MRASRSHSFRTRLRRMIVRPDWTLRPPPMPVMTRLKFSREWIPVWLKDPQAFRPGTKMPTFWRFTEDGEEGADDLKAVAAYLWQNSFDGKVPTQQQGDKNNGKTLF